MDKECARCGGVKPRADFYRNAGWRDGLHPYCKECLLGYQRDRRLAALDALNPNRRRWTKWSVEHSYFEAIDRPIKAYLLGLLAADGNVIASTPRVSLDLAVRDLKLVELFRNEVAPGVPIRRRPPRRRSGEQAVIAITSEQLVTDLARWGVIPRKTWSLDWPRHLPSNMRRPYLLGYFDGDGYITVAQRYRGRVYGRWGLCGTKPFLEEAMAFISADADVLPRTPHPCPGVYKLNIGGRDALSVDAWLHKGLPFGLARKRLTALIAAA
jgi:hypothetical protein